MPLKVQGQLKCVDQEACLQLIHEAGQRPQRQITHLGLVPRKSAESREQVTESLCVPEGFFNWMALESQPTKSVPRRVRLAIERNIVAMSPDRTLQPRTQRESMYMKSVETTRLLRVVSLIDEKCDLTEADAQEAAVRACHSANPGINHRWYPTDSLQEPRILHGAVYVAT